MKVLLVINSLDTGGAERLILDSLPKLSEQGLDVALLLLNGRTTPFLEALEQKKCCTIIKLSNGSVYNPLLILKLIPYTFRYNIIHVHLFPALYWVAFAKMISFSSAKLIFTEHNTTNRRRSNFFLKMIDRCVYARYARIVTISTEVKLFLKEHLGFKNKKFITITNGVDLEKFNTAHKTNVIEPTDTETERTIVQIAAFTKQKDQETLIKAIPYVTYPVRLVLVGEGPTFGRLKELAQALEIADKVSFLGIRTDVDVLLQSTHLAVLSSHYEGLSLAGVEAMASGTPLLASDVSGLKTLVHGAGVLFKHKDEIDLANNINALLSDIEYYAEIAASCQKRAQKYGLKAMVEAHIALYNDIYTTL